MKSNLILITAIVVIFILTFAFTYPQSLEAIAVTGASIVSILALWYARKEFEHHKKNDRTTLLCQYLHRYATDENIKKVIDYINDTALLDADGDIIGLDNKKLKELAKKSKSSSLPTQREKEMFMHFYEELQMLIDSNMLEDTVTIDLLGYYCGKFHNIKEYHQDITDYDNKNYWERYLRLANSSYEHFANSKKAN